MTRKKDSRLGFSIVEVLIVIAIFAIAATIVLSTFVNAGSAQALEKDVARITSLIERARSLTLSSYEGSRYGVHIESDDVTLFKGATYSAGVPDNVIETLNTKVEITGYVIAGGGADIVFDRLTGETAQTGTITVSLKSAPLLFFTVSVGATGLVEIQ